jgi:hypothetical protein
MRLLGLLTLVGLLMMNTGCSTFDEKELYGAWQNELLYMKFNEDKTLELKMGGDEVIKGKYTIFGNTLELINEKGTVVINPTVVKIENDSLYINMMRTGSDNIKVLAKVE